MQQLSENQKEMQRELAHCRRDIKENHRDINETKLNIRQNNQDINTRIDIIGQDMKQINQNMYNIESKVDLLIVKQTKKNSDKKRNCNCYYKHAQCRCNGPLHLKEVRTENSYEITRPKHFTFGADEYSTIDIKNANAQNGNYELKKKREPLKKSSSITIISKMSISRSKKIAALD